MNIEAPKQIQQTHCYSFVKPTRFRKVIQEFAGNGTLVLEGSEHRAHRKMLANPLSVPNIRKLQPIFEAKSRELCKLLDNAAASSGLIDCTEVFTKATLDIIGATVLGLELENPSSGTFDIKQDIHVAKTDTTGKKACSFHQAYEIIFEQGLLGKILLFANGFFPFRWMPIQENRKYMFCTDWVRRVLQQTISDRRAKVKNKMAFNKTEHNQKDSRDLLTFIVEETTSHYRAAAEEVTIDGVRIPKGTIVDIVPLTGDQLPPYAFQAFVSGSRMCIGKNYVMLDMKCMLIEMVPRFRFCAVDKPLTIENPGFAMRPTGLEARLEKIVSF
ncbi:hypothetical protein FSARC_6274 [Fusarium sarcochroum]|uniref:Cytochrome P450 monooxygenase n=1 Tax=Fusarium sarcochroum TaxID=1208366 RepID=A0A8H4TXJ3_9HYPO|nr:hypothetical protein FSARC_6274 [Fusarium sarcochroum]